MAPRTSLKTLLQIIFITDTFASNQCTTSLQTLETALSLYFDQTDIIHLVLLRGTDECIWVFL